MQLDLRPILAGDSRGGQQMIHVVAKSPVGRHAARRNVRLAEKPRLFEFGHDAPDHRGPHAQGIARGNLLRSDRFGGRDEFLNRRHQQRVTARGEQVAVGTRRHGPKSISILLPPHRYIQARIRCNGGAGPGRIVFHKERWPAGPQPARAVFISRRRRETHRGSRATATIAAHGRRSSRTLRQPRRWWMRAESWYRTSTRSLKTSFSPCSSTTSYGTSRTRCAAPQHSTARSLNRSFPPPFSRR